MPERIRVSLSVDDDKLLQEAMPLAIRELYSGSRKASHRIHWLIREWVTSKSEASQKSKPSATKK